VKTKKSSSPKPPPKNLHADVLKQLQATEKLHKHHDDTVSIRRVKARRTTLNMRFVLSKAAHSISLGRFSNADVPLRSALEQMEQAPEWTPEEVQGFDLLTKNAIEELVEERKRLEALQAEAAKGVKILASAEKLTNERKLREAAGMWRRLAQMGDAATLQKSSPLSEDAQSHRAAAWAVEESDETPVWEEFRDKARACLNDHALDTVRALGALEDKGDELVLQNQFDDACDAFVEAMGAYAEEAKSREQAITERNPSMGARLAVAHRTGGVVPPGIELHDPAILEARQAQIRTSAKALEAAGSHLFHTPAGQRAAHRGLGFQILPGADQMLDEGLLAADSTAAAMGLPTLPHVRPLRLQHNSLRAEGERKKRGLVMHEEGLKSHPGHQLAEKAGAVLWDHDARVERGGYETVFKLFDEAGSLYGLIDMKRDVGRMELFKLEVEAHTKWLERDFAASSSRYGLAAKMFTQAYDATEDALGVKLGVLSAKALSSEASGRHYQDQEKKGLSLGSFRVAIELYEDLSKELIKAAMYDESTLASKNASVLRQWIASEK